MKAALKVGGSKVAETRQVVRLPRGVPDAVRPMMQRLPLVPGEDVAEYEAILLGVAGDVRPRGFVEWVWVKDYVDNLWEGLRYRRVLKTLFDLSKTEHRQTNRSLPPHVLAERLAALKVPWQLNRPDTVTEREAQEAFYNVEKSLAELRVREARDEQLREAELIHPANLDQALTEAYLKHGDDLERVSRLNQASDRRRDAALRELERRRAGRAEQLRRKSDEILDAEFVVTPRPERKAG